MIDWTSWMDYGFMKMALAAILIITPLFGLMGTMIVNKKMAYFSDALGHSALTGIAVGVVCGIPDTNISMVIFAVKQNRKQKYRINRYDYFGFFLLFGCDWSGNPVKRRKFQ